MTVDMSDFDEAVARYVGAMKKSEEIAKKMRDANKPIEEIIEFTGLSEKTIREL
jgi:hypothetical protein